VTHVDVTSLDPRDAQWEEDVERFRVYFWSRGGDTVAEYELTKAADVREVLAWAGEQANGRVVEVFACAVCGGVPGLLRLAGGRPEMS